MSNPALASVGAASAEDAVYSSEPSYASSAINYPNAEAGPSNYTSPSDPAPASPSTPAGALQALAPVRASGQDEGSGVVMLPTAPNVFTDKQLDEYKEQDRYLPIANVGRIMKNSLPESAKIAKEAKECVQECVSEFISFLSSEAADKVQTDKRKTINGEDILYSMTTLGFDNYAEACKVYLAKYRMYVSEHIPSRVHSRDASPVIYQELEEGLVSEDVQTRPGGKRARPSGGTAAGSTEDDLIPQVKRSKGPANA